MPPNPVASPHRFRIDRIAGPLVLAAVLLLGAYSLIHTLSKDAEQGRGVATKSLSASVVASRVVAITNENRTSTGLPKLVTSELLTRAAQLKAEDMASKSYYAHVSPEGHTPLYWLDLVGYRYLNAGENLVIDRTTSEDVVEAWMLSATHRSNILRPQFTEIGVGVAKGEYKGQKTIYVVQEFGTPYPTVRVAAAPKAVVAPPVSVEPVQSAPPKPVAPPKAPAPKPATEPEPKPVPAPVPVQTSQTEPVATTTTQPVQEVVAEKPLDIPLPIVEPDVIQPIDLIPQISLPELPSSNTQRPTGYNPFIDFGEYLSVQVRSMVSTYDFP